MVGLVLVSHSKKLAQSVRDMIVQMTAPDFPVAIASGAGESHEELGTDAVHIADVLQKIKTSDGVLVLMDLGSAVLRAQTALELLEPALAKRICLCAAPLVEGAIAASVQAHLGGTLEEVAREAQRGLKAKEQQIQSDSPSVLPADTPSTAVSKVSELILTVENEHGLHARPAAILIRTISRFRSSIEITNLTSGRGPAPARSLTSLALLQIRKGDRIGLTGTGVDCEAALRAVRELAADGFGERLAKVENIRKVSPAQGKPGPVGVCGVPASEGIAIGPLTPRPQSAIALEKVVPGSPVQEFAKLKEAMKAVREELSFQQPRTPADANVSDILEAQALILSDPVLLKKLESFLGNQALSAGQAWSQAMEELVGEYESMDDEYLRGRASDVRDLANHVLRKLGGSGSPGLIRLAEPGILFVDELLPSEATACDPNSVLGVIARSGSATSHSAIILRTLGIPAVVGVSGIAPLNCGKTVAIDGGSGEVWLEPDLSTRNALENRRREGEEITRRAQSESLRPCITLDGTRIEMLANVGSVDDALEAAHSGAEGIGLLRTEVLFLSQKQAPSEGQQMQALGEIFAAIPGPITVRTFDVGADKPLPFLPQSEERNPYLGLRGIRLFLKSPELCVAQLRAILRAGVHRDLALMFPMIATVEETQGALDLLDRAHQQLKSKNQPHAWPVKRGIMIEVPSAALMSAQLAEHLEFFSIGTNDLTQYTMAAERGNATVARLQDALHPAVLRLMKLVVEGARGRDRHVSVCGDAASDPVAAAIFVGLGINSLSVRPRQVAAVKAFLRSVSEAQLKAVAEQALQYRDATQVRALVAESCDGLAARDRSLRTQV